MTNDDEIAKRIVTNRYTKSLQLKKDFEVTNIFASGWKSTRLDNIYGSVSIHINPKKFGSKDSFSLEVDLDTLKELVALVENEAKKDETSESLNPKTLKTTQGKKLAVRIKRGI